MILGTYLISEEESKEESPDMCSINISVSKYNYLMIPESLFLKILTLKYNIFDKSKGKIIIREQERMQPSLLIQVQE